MICIFAVSLEMTLILQTFGIPSWVRCLFYPLRELGPKGVVCNPAGKRFTLSRNNPMKRNGFSSSVPAARGELRLSFSVCIRKLFKHIKWLHAFHPPECPTSQDFGGIIDKNGWWLWHLWLVTAAARRALEVSSPQRRAVAAGGPTFRRRHQSPFFFFHHWKRGTILWSCPLWIQPSRGEILFDLLYAQRTLPRH